MTLVVLGAVAGCGVVGPPIAPENVGVAPIIEQQKRQQAGQRLPTIEGTQSHIPEVIAPPAQDEELPPLRPIGTR